MHCNLKKDLQKARLHLEISSFPIPFDIFQMAQKRFFCSYRSKNLSCKTPYIFLPQKSLSFYWRTQLRVLFEVLFLFANGYQDKRAPQHSFLSPLARFFHRGERKRSVYSFMQSHPKRNHLHRKRRFAPDSRQSLCHRLGSLLWRKWLSFSVREQFGEMRFQKQLFFHIFL